MQATSASVRLPRLAWAWAGVLVALLAAAAPLAATLHTDSSPVPLFTAAVVFGSFGILIATRRPHNPAGWLLLVAATGEVLTVALSSYGQYAERNAGSLPWGRLVWTVGGMGWWVLPFAMLPMLVIVFPDGHLPGPRWRLVQRLLVGAAAAAVIVVGLAQSHIDGDSGAPANPLHNVLPQSVTRLLVVVTFLSVTSCVVVSFVGLVLRMRRAKGAERAQHQWLAAGMATFAVFAVAGFIPPLPQQLVGVGFVAFLGSMTVAILRFRLYDLGRVISRTVSYALITGLLAGLYVCVVTVMTKLLPISSAFGVATSTLAVAAAFQPLRRHVQTVVDHRFNRSRYDAQTVVEMFVTRLRDHLDPETVTGDLVATTSRALQPTSLSIWTPFSAKSRSC